MENAASSAGVQIVSKETEPQSTQPIRVAIVEDDRPTRDGLGLLVNGTPGYRCVGTFNSVESALRGMDHSIPEVLLLDIDLPGMLGSEGVREFRQRYPSLQIIMLTVYAEQDRVFESICNGACGYLLKETPPAKLLESIREAHHGGAPMSPEIARKVVQLFQKTGPSEKFDEQLTTQEKRVLEMLMLGYSYKRAADQLNISINTVRDYIRSIYDKLHVHSKSEAVAKALRNRLIR
jgi:DNA-binding NarL/FixJ family response regulator